MNQSRGLKTKFTFYYIHTAKNVMDTTVNSSSVLDHKLQDQNQRKYSITTICVCDNNMNTENRTFESTKTSCLHPVQLNLR